MISSLYWVLTLTYALVLFSILAHDFKYNKKLGRVETTFRRLLIWVIIFCLQDAVWGVCANLGKENPDLFWWSSTLFHVSTVLTTFFWLNFVLTYLEDGIKHKKQYLLLDGIIIAIQFGLLIINYFTPVAFYIDESGRYCDGSLRVFGFLNQYIVYLLLGICALVSAVAVEGKLRKQYLAVFIFSLAPIVFGIVQFIYPYGPFDSIGYFLACFMIHIFIVSEDRETLRELQIMEQKAESERKIAEQIAISNTDEMTGIFNRRAYEEDLKNFHSNSLEEDFIYITLDVNNLKSVNDSLGHAAGDELIKGTADCMTKCLGEYGKIYRTGGDEFVAIINLDNNQLSIVKESLNSTISEWRGIEVESLSASVGVVTRKEFPEMSVMEMARVADDRMYSEKKLYYLNKGIDRRGQQIAYLALRAMYIKILKICLNEDKYYIINANEHEIDISDTGKLSVWLKEFVKLGMIHPDDIDEFSKKTDIEYMRNYFWHNDSKLKIVYRRKNGETYIKALMEIIKAENYSDNNQLLYLYVKELD